MVVKGAFILLTKAPFVVACGMRLQLPDVEVNCECVRSGTRQWIVRVDIRDGPEAVHALPSWLEKRGLRAGGLVSLPKSLPVLDQVIFPSPGTWSEQHAFSNPGTDINGYYFRIHFSDDASEVEFKMRLAYGGDDAI